MNQSVANIIKQLHDMGPSIVSLTAVAFTTNGEIKILQTGGNADMALAVQAVSSLIQAQMGIRADVKPNPGTAPVELHEVKKD